MGSHWKTEARRAGYDPARVTDVPLSFGTMSLEILLQDMKGARIGDGTGCSGANCIKRRLDADWAYVGATTAIVAPTGGKGKLLRFKVNGLAKLQDRTMNVIGEKITLRSPKVAGKRPTRSSKSPKAKATTTRRKPQHSLAAQLRSS